MSRFKNSGVLSAARAVLGLQTRRIKKRAVFEAAAKRLGVAEPKNVEQGYDMLRRLLGRKPAPPKAKQVADPGDVNGPDFLSSYEWRRLRMSVIVKRGARCECCGASPKDGIRINVDHVKPRRLFPELALDESNLQVLCEECNHGKGNWDQTDWRIGSDIPAIPTMPVVRLHESIRDMEEVNAIRNGDPMRPRLVKRSA